MILASGRSDCIHNKLDGLTGFFSSLAGALLVMELMLIGRNGEGGPDQGKSCASSLARGRRQSDWIICRGDREDERRRRERCTCRVVRRYRTTSLRSTHEHKRDWLAAYARRNQNAETHSKHAAVPGRLMASFL